MEPLKVCKTLSKFEDTSVRILILNKKTAEGSSAPGRFLLKVLY